MQLLPTCRLDRTVELAHRSLGPLNRIGCLWRIQRSGLGDDIVAFGLEEEMTTLAGHPGTRNEKLLAFI